MEWIAIRNQSQPVMEYHLMENNSCKAILKYNTQQRVARLHIGDNYGVFFIEKRKAFQNKNIIRNEYGVAVGKLSVDKSQAHPESIELDGEKYYYTFRNDPFAELVLYKNDAIAPVARCGLKMGADHTQVVFAKNNYEEHLPILLGLCWYLLLSVEVENEQAALVHSS